MELFEHDISYKNGVPYTLIFTGDWHLGHGACDLPKIEKLLQKLETMENALVFLMGDTIEAISPADPRFDAYSVSDDLKPHIGRIIDRQYEQAKSLLEPIKDKVILIHEGNHELKIRKQHYRDVTLDLCRELEANYGKYAAITRLRFTLEGGGQVRQFDLFTCHGHGGSRKKGAKLNSLDDISNYFLGMTITAMGHTHERMIVPGTKLSLTRRGSLKLKEEEYLLINTGTYLKTYERDVSNYTEQRMYPPTSLGAVGVKISPRYEVVEGFYL